MAVTSVSTHWTGQNGSWKFDKFARKYQTSAIVICNSRSDDANTAISAVMSTFSLTMGTSTYTSDTNATLTEASAQLKEVTKAGLLWNVTLTYDCDVPLETTEDPRDEEVVYSGAYEKYNRTVVTDLDGAAVLNSAGDTFDSPPEQETSRLKLTLVKNYDSVTFNAVTDLDPLRDTTNNSDWNGFPQYTCKMAGISFKREKRNGIKFYSVSFEISVDTLYPWHPSKVLDMGYREFDGSANGKEILDSHGNPIAKPRLLDGAGHPLATASPPVYRDFKFYRPADWSTVPLPGV